MVDCLASPPGAPFERSHYKRITAPIGLPECDIQGRLTDSLSRRYDRPRPPTYRAGRTPTVDFGSFTTGLLTGLREGVEAALIVSIILAYLYRTGNGKHAGKVWIGTGIAVALSALIG